MPPFLINLCAMGHLDSQRSLPTLGVDKTGFSPLAKKLRLVAGQSVLVLNAQDRQLEMLRPGPADLVTRADPGRAYDAVVLFVGDVDELRRLGPPAVRATRPSGLLWIAYPKGGETEGATDLPATPWWVQRDVLGEITAEKGYKPIAFVAVDETWTALRFKKV
jgi:hypothetical protein